MSFYCSVSRTTDLANEALNWCHISDINKHYARGSILVITKIFEDHAGHQVYETNHTTLEIYSLYDIKTYQKFGLNILENASIVNHA